MRRLLLVVVCAWASACGPGTAHRPLNLSILNLSASAESLEVALFTLDVVDGCASLANSSPEPAAFSTWQRASMAERALELPALDDDTIILEVIAKDAGGSPLQRACRVVEWADLEQPELDIELSPVGNS